MRKRSRKLLLFSEQRKKKNVETKKEPSKIYSALEVARHIVNYSNYSEQYLSNLKLQKILYFVQAEFLISQGRVCFADGIEAWDFGPVIPAVLHEFMRFGSCFILPVTHYFVEDENKYFNIRKVEFKDNVISDEDKAAIDEVVDYFADYSSVDLTNLTQKQPPWQNAYSGCCRSVIATESIKEYFSNREQNCTKKVQKVI